MRINLVVAHEFGHQLEFCLSQATQNKIRDLYDARVRLCNSKHPLPLDYEGQSELLTPQQVPERCSSLDTPDRASMNIGQNVLPLFSIKDSRDYLKKLDPEVYEILVEVITKPENVMRRVFTDNVLELQSSLRVGGELTANLIN